MRLLKNPFLQEGSRFEMGVFLQRFVFLEEGDLPPLESVYFPPGC